MSKPNVPTLRRCRALAQNHAEVDRTHDARAMRALGKTGVSILAQRHNGRRTVVVVDHPPAFVRGGLCRRYTRPAGTVVHTYAAPWRGLQLEWCVQPELGHV